MSHNPWVWIAALLTFCIFSFLYKDNPFYKFAEHIFIGVSLGYLIAIVWHLVVIPRIWDPLQKGIYITIIPMCLGVLMFSRFSRRWAWLSRWPIAFVLGTGSGIALPLVMQTYIFRQLQGTMVISTTNLWLTISAVIIIIGVISTLLYFYFSVEHKGPLGAVANVGMWFIMIAFGASFGYTVMARVSLLIGRLQFLMYDWLGVIK
ncbi:MAG: hypothetical protein QMD71_05915 [bacterium]|nr:hypothetical protein [bacterium]